MEISHLRVFQTVAKTGSVSSAAHNSNCVQSNVTARIKGLKDELGSGDTYLVPLSDLLFNIYRRDSSQPVLNGLSCIKA